MLHLTTFPYNKNFLSNISPSMCFHNAVISPFIWIGRPNPSRRLEITRPTQQTHLYAYSAIRSLLFVLSRPKSLKCNTVFPLATAHSGNRNTHQSARRENREGGTPDRWKINEVLG